MSESRLLRLPAVVALTGLSRSTLYARAADGRFPKPIKLCTRASAWVASEVEHWVRDRISASRGTEVRS